MRLLGFSQRRSPIVAGQPPAMIELRKRPLVRVPNRLVGIRVGSGRRCNVTAALPLGAGRGR